MNLFIIGNGFDLAHGLATTYNDFKKYLQKTYPNAIEDIYTIPDQIVLPDGGIKYDEVAVVSFILGIISRVEGDKWKNLESTLGELELDDFFEFFELQDDDKENRIYYNNEDNSKNILGSIIEIKRLFAEWVDTIDLTNTKIDYNFSKLKKDDDLFLSMNYTYTLEQVYGISEGRIVHLHGKQKEDIIFGHGNSKNYWEHYNNYYTGAEENISELYEALRKDTEQVIRNNSNFFKKQTLESVSNIYSYGFSFSNVDQIYITEICKYIKNNVIWFLNNYDKEKNAEFKKIIEECGFKGTFNTF